MVAHKYQVGTSERAASPLLGYASVRCVRVVFADLGYLGDLRRPPSSAAKHPSVHPCSPSAWFFPSSSLFCVLRKLLLAGKRCAVCRLAGDLGAARILPKPSHDGTDVTVNPSLARIQPLCEV